MIEPRMVRALLRSPLCCVSWVLCVCVRECVRASGWVRAHVCVRVSLCDAGGGGGGDKAYGGPLNG